jgi:hypothetical protein
MAVGLRVVNFATSKNVVAKSTMFPHRHIHKYSWTSYEGKTHNQIDCVRIDRRRHSSIFYVRIFRGADCDSDHYLVVENVRERLAMSKPAAQKTDMERFDLKKLNEGKLKVPGYNHKHVCTSRKIKENNGDFSRTWDSVRQNIGVSAQKCLGYCESKYRKTWFDEVCSKIADRRKQAKLQWLQDPSEVNENNQTV